MIDLVESFRIPWAQVAQNIIGVIKIEEFRGAPGGSRGAHATQNTIGVIKIGEFKGAAGGSRGALVAQCVVNITIATQENNMISKHIKCHETVPHKASII